MWVYRNIQSRRQMSSTKARRRGRDSDNSYGHLDPGEFRVRIQMRTTRMDLSF